MDVKSRRVIYFIVHLTLFSLIAREVERGEMEVSAPERRKRETGRREGKGERKGERGTERERGHLLGLEM